MASANVPRSDYKVIEGYANGVLAGSPGVYNGQAHVFGYNYNDGSGRSNETALRLDGRYASYESHSIENTGERIWFLSQAAQKIVDKYPGDFDYVYLAVMNGDDEINDTVTLVTFTFSKNKT
jgi:hypothetical protein